MTKIFFILILVAFSSSKGQTFGFGCLGLSGFYAGITHQYYDTPGLNEYINSSILFSNYNTRIDFKRGTGYRIGANIFRAKFDVLFITAKGYYQFLKESYERTNVNPEEGNQKFELAMNHWGVGLDFGVPLFSIVDWKIVEGNVTFYNAELTEEYLNTDGAQTSETKYNLDKVKVGYFVGSGLILHLVPDYISVEATAGFSFIDIEKFSKDDVVIPISTSSNKAVNKGGFSATVQLNVGFPL
ncbi:MAG: hypothetical protein AB1521_12400 [Bacteroidota bacterium]